MENIDTKIRMAHNQMRFTNFDLYFDRIYNFTTENIQGYITAFDLKDKSLLTVGSSSDQVFNAFYCDCKDITLMDINPYIKEYFYLKKAAIMTLDYEDFFKFLSIQGEKNFNFKALNKRVYRKVSENIDDAESKRFWDEILGSHMKEFVKLKLFSFDTNSVEEIKAQNNYLKTEENYKKIKKTVKNLKPKFIVEDIYEYQLDKKYDNIFLSNIADYYDVDDTHNLYRRLQEKNLNEDGKILVSYLYKTNKDTPYEEKYCKIYNLEKTLPLFDDVEIETVKSVDRQDPRDDSILVYHKK